MAKGIIAGLVDKKGIELWHVIAVLAIAAAIIYFTMGKAPEASMIGVKCWDQNSAGVWSPIDCKTGKPSAQTMAIVTPVGGTATGSVDGISFVYTVSNAASSININANVASVICKTLPTPGSDAPACSTNAGKSSAGGAFTQLAVAHGAQGTWQTSIVPVQSIVPANDLPDGSYRLTVSVTGTDPNGIVAPATQIQSLDFTNAHETVSFSVGVVITA